MSLFLTSHSNFSNPYKIKIIVKDKTTQKLLNEAYVDLVNDNNDTIDDCYTKNGFCFIETTNVTGTGTIKVTKNCYTEKVKPIALASPTETIELSRSGCTVYVNRNPPCPTKICDCAKDSLENLDITRLFNEKKAELENEIYKLTESNDILQKSNTRYIGEMCKNLAQFIDTTYFQTLSSDLEQTKCFDSWKWTRVKFNIQKDFFHFFTNKKILIELETEHEKNILLSSDIINIRTTPIPYSFDPIENKNRYRGLDPYTLNLYWITDEKKYKIKSFAIDRPSLKCY